MSAWPPAGSIRTHDRGSVPPVRDALRQRHRPWSALVAMAVAVLLLAAPGAAAAAAAPVAQALEPEARDAGEDEAAPAAPDDPPPTTARVVVNGLQAVVGTADDRAVPASEEVPRLPSTFRARVLVENLTDEPLDGLRLVVTVYQRVTTRSTLRAALDGSDTTGLGDIEDVAVDLPLDPLQAGRIAQLEVAVDAAEHGLIDPDTDVALHPIAISVVRGISVLDEVRTAAVGISRAVAHPMEAVALAPLDGPAPATGSLSESADQLLPGGRLDRILRALEAAPAGTATVAPAAHAVEDLQRLVDSAQPGATDMLARVRAVVAEQADGVVSTPYAMADVPALATTTATSDLATAAIVAGRQRILGLVGEAPDAAHLLMPGQTAASLDLAPADVLLLPWGDDAGPDLAANPSADVPPALRSTRSESGRALDVLVGDPWVTAQLATATGAHGWEVDAHRVIAETAMTFAQAPGRAGRALVVLPPVGWEAPGRLADELYGRLAATPWLRLADPVTVAGRSNVTAAWEPPPDVDAERAGLLARVGTLQDRLEGLAAAVVDVEQRPAVVSQGDDLLRAVSVWPTENPTARTQQVLDMLAEDIEAAIGEVVVPRDSVVTLASERGVIPVTVQHPEGVPMDVLVEVTTQGRLTFREGTTRTVRLEEGGTTTVSFEATALGRGTFPMRVTVRTPTGDVVLAGEIIRVRASAVSQPALVAIGGVVLLLLLVGRLRRRRPDRPKLEVVR